MSPTSYCHTMNTLNHSKLSVLAAATAGAVVLGVAGGVAAGPRSESSARGAKATVAGDATSTLRSVVLTRHGGIELTQLDAAALRLRAKVSTSQRLQAAEVPASLGVTLALFGKKVAGQVIAGSQSELAAVNLKPKKKASKQHRYAGSVLVGDVWSADQLAVLAQEVADNGRVAICIGAVSEQFDRYSKQARLRLDLDTKRPVRTCVQVVDSTEDDDVDQEAPEGVEEEGDQDPAEESPEGSDAGDAEV